MRSPDFVRACALFHHENEVQVSLVVSEHHDCEIKHARRINNSRKAYAVRRLEVERCRRP